MATPTICASFCPSSCSGERRGAFRPGDGRETARGAQRRAARAGAQSDFDRIRKRKEGPTMNILITGAGSGIGLAVCEEIVTRHEGKLTIGNAEGGGCLVTIRLPVET